MLQTVIEYKRQTIQGVPHISYSFPNNHFKARYKAVPTKEEEEAFFIGIVEGLNLVNVDVIEFKEVE